MLLCVNPYACTDEDELGVGKYWRSPVEVETLAPVSVTWEFHDVKGLACFYRISHIAYDSNRWVSKVASVKSAALPVMKSRFSIP